ncbi:MAG: metalloregulator ArsR/SmtB family transcription factor [Chloroflexi bacterium]|nr:metalloregulator ArsR/SmtB family transcription factor [Chloroflexota bacterium]MDA1226760.1 metalloregulator ArsR/SmtB family transcription factor [Chloroflexota bacterium]
MIEEALRAIAEPRRRDILRLLHDNELAAGDIASHFEVTRPAISQHLKVLADCQLVEVRRQGTRRIYRIRPDTMSELRQYMEQFWQDSLSRLAEVAEAAESNTGSPRSTPRGE